MAPGYVVASLMAIVLLVSAVDARIKFFIDNTIAQAPTYDLYQISTPSYNYTGPLLLPSFSDDPDADACTLKPLNSSRDRAVQGDVMQQEGVVSVIGVPWKTADAAGCGTYAHLASSVAALNSSVTAAAYPGIQLLVVFIDSPLSGGPFRDPYTNHKRNLPDGKPAVTTALVPMKKEPSLPGLLESWANPDTYSTVVVEVTEEPGPWNEVFFTREYTATVWILMAINVCMIFCALVPIVKMLVRWEFTLDLRNGVSVASVLATILFSSTLPLRYPTMAYTQLLLTTSLFYNLGFGTLMLLWGRILASIRGNRGMLLLKLVIGLWIMISLFSYISQMITLRKEYSPALLKYVLASSYALSSGQVLLALSFLYYGGAFYFQRRAYKIPSRTRKALARITLVAVLGFFTYIIFAVANQVIIYDKSFENTKTALAYMLLGMLGNTLRAFALLFAIGPRGSSDSRPFQGSTDGSDGTLNDWRTAGHTTASAKFRPSDSCESKTAVDDASSNGAQLVRVHASADLAASSLSGGIDQSLIHKAPPPMVLRVVQHDV
ncbi:hypothetical protein THASP1DRAFT_28813 [Thamnocephalis sphaerospora]|uniref:Lung seven transmembrane receptor-domain-containing protein n=1 Tax=Thamnocephalis sphaerospora TaxID=78915 RepID=A0A4P9XTA2_9FUNG|nr:hypothetical protein THASP1DRAFT_28813 [Thamnocephalis sphaerospora]|eukprot:RKP09387.1 hypothetical protein THASP1DRAFT_28813 [Thamnocephalis sphaerospora]